MRHKDDFSIKDYRMRERTDASPRESGEAEIKAKNVELYAERVALCLDIWAGERTVNFKVIFQQDPRPHEILTFDLLKREVIENGKSYNELAEELNIPQQTIWGVAQRLGITKLKKRGKVI